MPQQMTAHECTIWGRKIAALAQEAEDENMTALSALLNGIAAAILTGDEIPLLIRLRPFFKAHLAALERKTVIQ
jgi:hypothetical protein